MPSSTSIYDQSPGALRHSVKEGEIEYGFIGKLQGLKYGYRPDIRDRAALEANFRDKFQELNRVKLTDEEFARLLEEITTPDVFTAAQTLRTRTSFIRADGTPLNYTLVNIDDWCKNTFEVVNQLRINTDYSHHRFDVVLLINGVPVVQIELKTLGINPRRAIEQIVEYKNDPGNGFARTLLCFMQVFVVSNQHSTYYFANNNARHFSFNADERFLPIYQFAAPDNTKINGLDEFADVFLAKCTLGQMISRYMVLVASEQKLLMMRPYQIYAVKNIVKCIEENSGNGYIWHTTGSGKTLTSFKASTLLKANPNIEKCLFVVDRKDLDRQTREEFNRFQEGCVESNTNTGELVRRLLSDDAADKVIVCTIQKLGLALNENSRRNKSRETRGLSTYAVQLEALRDKRIIFIFDECHRSQFGENHQTIKEFFPKAQLFGFTGTPIFSDNATYKQITGEEQTLKTTEDLFQQCLHEYTITHAIEDRNVLKFHVDYFKPDGKNPPKQGEKIAKRAIIEAILTKHDAATGARKFNAIFATASINDAIEYYRLFDEAQAEKQQADASFVPLNVAAVFSPPSDVSADVRQLQEDLPTELEDNKQEPDAKKAALAGLVASYNARFGTNHRIEEFDLYYQDVQQRIKDQQWPDADLRKANPGAAQHKIDITIVVDMLLTGFDSKYLNTLYVDKNLKHHGLIQAFSRTNRVLNDTKPYGHILDFRGQEDAVKAAITMFSGAADKARAREIWLVDKAPVVIEKLQEAKVALQSYMQAHGLSSKPEDVAKLMGDEARVGFVKAFKDVQKLQTQLDQYTDVTPEQAETIHTILPPDELNAFRGQYLEIAKRLRDERASAGNRAVDDRNEDLAQLDFEFVLFASATIDYDYIMKLIADFSTKKPGKATMSREQLVGLIASDAKFIDERDDITEYVMSLKAGEGLDERAIRAGYQQFKAVKAARELTDVAACHGLTAAALQSFVDSVLERRIFDGEQLTELLTPLDLGWKARTQKELALMSELVPLLKKRAGGREISGLQAYED
ncbi:MULTISPECIES: type I restriction endonuclease subunit R [unclassified Polaromonas]|jgi:type I restriction enzyme R subunit|uniref:type I restriction endonuclease subunit R n=1 Tax=unclassified Polaromonas TaxID=2638319 RepID=UPI000BCA9146|nr:MULTISPECIES: type I restriction endonuclease subunit R [unclassified Polaromonas]OYY37964.1 MAG: DEAD/DEAH box helicase [Polaromonas sp. 35-63-35]OYZ21145.1 MAG: DEAD/DEAH box helicase [Polaromonas sp. 16-63-31]OYZ79511.1 MAG: DEAD/DEAH box helicase [Polaromonas sp. 24-63-21]OZA50657.1 MAG: DEAD/DEAH box helicase [Polaromonas sp. 17-63-33]OZA89516.1 MAG: DEAD/DEAH box helicase [Polaromonas sp. 39-63-25]